MSHTPTSVINVHVDLQLLLDSLTDTSLERNSLMTYVYPELQEYCRRVHGVSFQVVDMRWGVRDEATDDHLTTALCLKELESCQRLSIGPNFVVRPIWKSGEFFHKYCC